MEKRNPASIGIYIDDKMNIAFIPTLYTKIGYGQSISYFKLLKPPYTYSDIGATFKCVFNDMKSQPILNGDEDIVPAFKIITNGKGYLTFQRKRQLIEADFHEGINLQYWYRQKRGFGIEKGDEDISIRLPHDCLEEEIGNAVDAIFFRVNQKHMIEND